MARGADIRRASPRALSATRTASSAAALRRAVENGTLARNVAAIRKPPAVEQDEIEILAPEQIAAVLDSLKGHSLHPIAVPRACYRYAARRTARTANGATSTSTVACSASSAASRKRRPGLRLKSPKDETRPAQHRLAGRQPSPCCASIARRRSSSGCARAGRSPPTSCSATVEGELLSPNNVTRSWRRALQGKKLPQVQLPCLRHTHASTLIRAGVDVLTISRAGSGTPRRA